MYPSLFGSKLIEQHVTRPLKHFGPIKYKQDDQTQNHVTMNAHCQIKTGMAEILTEYDSARKRATPIPRSWKIGVGIGIEKSTHRPPCFAEYFVSNVEKSPVQMR
jgi:hypothetical protein